VVHGHLRATTHGSGAARGLISRLLMKEYGAALRRHGWPAPAFSGIVFAALHVLFFLDTQSLFLVMAGMIMLLVSATRSSWFFVMDLQEKQGRSPSLPPAESRDGGQMKRKGKTDHPRPELLGLD